jgi:hypothetical protein
VLVDDVLVTNQRAVLLVTERSSWQRGHHSKEYSRSEQRYTMFAVSLHECIAMDIGTAADGYRDDRSPAGHPGRQ